MLTPAPDPGNHTREGFCEEGDLIERMHDVDTDLEEVGANDLPQPTLSEILQAVQKCTVSVVDLKERFEGLQEEVSLPRQDLEHIRKRRTVAEGRISDLED